MEAELKKTLKAVTLELRHLLEGRYDQGGKRKPGDLEQRLAAIGVRRDRPASVPVDELGHLAGEDRLARKVVDAYLKLRDEAGVERSEAVAEFIRETAYTWANRLLALRCMEARELIDPVIFQQEAYGGRSLEHHRLAQRHPELCAGDDDGLFAVLDKVFRTQAGRLPMLFDPQAPGIALRPSAAALKDCFGLLSLNPDTLRKYRIRLTDDETDSPSAKPPNPFTAPDALGWAYQYWNTEEKDRVFETVRTVKGAKIAGADIVPATQLYTEDYMVKFLVQNSLGVTWTGMHPESKLAENWEYYVKDADRAPVAKKPVREITFLDPACGSGHFHLEAFDLFYAMYKEEGKLTVPEEICNAILTENLFGIDIDPRAVQIAEVALWMKAAERAFDYQGVPTNLVAATSSHLDGDAWEEFLAGFEREPSVARVLMSFARTMKHIDEIGSLARPAENLREIIKEEHETWERQVSQKQEANYLFPEMNEAATSGQLPFHEISDEEFGDRLFYRAKAGIDAFTERARAAGDFEDQMLGSETRAGFRLVDLLSRRYDVVAANPPYMGSRQMGPVLKEYLKRNYPFALRDLCGAFIWASKELTKSGGFLATVAQHSWLFSFSFAELRHNDAETGVLDCSHLRLIAHLGPHAFSEMSGEVVSVALTVCHNFSPAPESCVVAVSTVHCPSPTDKASALLRKKDQSAARWYRIQQDSFRKIPNWPAVYWIEKDLLSLFEREPLDSTIVPAQGLKTSNNARFVRHHWEVPPHSHIRWFPFAKGEGFRRWVSADSSMIDWQLDGQRPKLYNSEILGGQHWSRNITNTDTYFRPALVYTYVASGCLSVREIDGQYVIDAGSPVMPLEDTSRRRSLLAYLNTRVACYLARILSQNLFNMTGVRKLPFVVFSNPRIPEQYVVGCIEIKDWLRQWELASRWWSPEHSIFGGTVTSCIVRLMKCALLHTLEGALERHVVKELSLSSNSIDAVFQETGRPAAWNPVVVGYDSLPWEDEATVIGLADCLRSNERLDLSSDHLGRLRESLRSEYEESTGTVAQQPEDLVPDVEGEVEEDLALIGARIPLPSETLVEELSEALGIHPISIYGLLKEGIEKEGWRRLSEERGIVADRCSFRVLSAVGHHWPKQSIKRLTKSSGVEGIGLLTQGGGKATLVDRIHRPCPAESHPQNTRLNDNSQEALKELEAEFIEVMGMPLDGWLTNEFFKHHTKQFKKRPMAWQIQSGKFTIKNAPAFACLVYYQELDADTLQKLRSQYIGPLRQRLETELRGILAIAGDARSDRQEKRRAELDDAIQELQKFDTVLETVARTGFGPKLLLPMLRRYAFEDAMLALKARWLRRLNEMIAKSPLPDWLAAADRTELHPDYRVWVAEAMAHLDYYCAKVGPKAPDQAKLTSDPIAADLAKLIAPHGKEMLKDTLELACDQWYAQFDEVVLGPDKDKIKKLREEQKGCEEQLNAEPAPSAGQIRDLKYRVKEIKEDVKALTAKIKRKAALANKVRAQIESWQSKEPLGWGDWLAGQPLFDRIASLDGRQPAPTTIAEFITQESMYAPDINDGVRVNIAPLQKAGVLAADVLAAKDLDKAIADRAEWRADERRWVREGKLPQPGWWPEKGDCP